MKKQSKIIVSYHGSGDIYDIFEVYFNENEIHYHYELKGSCVTCQEILNTYL